MTDHLYRLIERYPALAACRDDLRATHDTLAATFRAGGKLLLCGNGGSAADCEHITGELMKSFLKPRPLPTDEIERIVAAGGADLGGEIAGWLQGALPAVALTSSVSLGSAVLNDTHGEMIHAQQVHGLGRAGDALLGISTSGNARNVLNACVVARARGMRTILLTGRTGGKLLPYADVAIRVPADHVVEIQEYHLPIYHALCLALEETFFPS